MTPARPARAQVHVVIDMVITTLKITQLFVTGGVLDGRGMVWLGSRQASMAGARRESRETLKMLEGGHFD
jgi:hypothetical protein